MKKIIPTERDALLDQGLDFILNSPDEEFEVYLIEGGFDVADLDVRADAAFSAALKTYGQQKRAAAKLTGNRLAELAQGFLGRLPEARAELLAIYQRLVAESQAAGKQLSLQHRELSGEVSAGELRQMIAEIQALQAVAGESKE